MPSDTELFFDGLADLANVIAESPRLTDWFCILLVASAEDRPRIIQEMVSRMMSGSEDPQLIRTIALLADPRILRAVEMAVRERR